MEKEGGGEERDVEGGPVGYCEVCVACAVCVEGYLDWFCLGILAECPVLIIRVGNETTTITIGPALLP